MADANVQLSLSAAEALVLFELLAREEYSDGLKFEDPAEQRVLWVLQGQLESTLVEPFKPDYHQRLAQARRKLRKKYG